VAGVFRTRIQAGESNERIGAMQRHALQGVKHAAAHDDPTQARDLAQTSVLLLAILVRFDEGLPALCSTHPKTLSCR
jgi:hypothetical protein